MNFDEALIQLKKGKKLYRTGWANAYPDSGLVYVTFVEKSNLIIHYDSKLTEPEPINLEPFILIHFVDTKIHEIWLANQDDVFTDDWEYYIEELDK